jgi:hypothetical protein
MGPGTGNKASNDLLMDPAFGGWKISDFELRISGTDFELI